MQLLQTSSCSQESVLSWATRISKTRVSTVNGFSLPKTYDLDEGHTLEGVLRTVQRLGIARCNFEDLAAIEAVGEGGTSSVTKCDWKGRVVAVKYIKLDVLGNEHRFYSLERRLRSVLQEICIMHHEPLVKHPNILGLLGYGWQIAGGAPLPYIVVEYGACGTLRSWLRSKASTGTAWLRAKLTMAAFVAAGLMALHECGIVHGDLKLDNVIVFGDLDRPADAIAKIADFSHSILVSEISKEATFYGTSLYV